MQTLQFLGRCISLVLRRLTATRDRGRLLRVFARGMELQRQLPPPRSSAESLLLIRVDDIGDYVLFHNQLALYKQSARWQGHRITLLGNQSWRELFALLDPAAVDDTIWVDKDRYFPSATYRLTLWRELRARGFGTVIAPSRTRNLLLDDLCLLAAAPERSLGAANTQAHAQWNRRSDALYSALFRPSRELLHEFQFNAEFAEWACGMRASGDRPRIELPPRPAASRPEPYIMCFVGGSRRSKRWSVKRWIEFIDAYRRGNAGQVVLAGRGRAELELSALIQRRTDAINLVGTLSLPELLSWVAGADAVITNDTMAAHLAVALEKPAVIISNGIEYMRFAEYRAAGIGRIATVYPEVFNRWRRRVGEGHYGHRDTVSTDIDSIPARAVLEALEGITRVSGTALSPPGTRAAL
ncbi:MAG TPA: glycosyltransferase family 9 protein [Steroidobacteraceae bacterium]|jgi:ADP-heptose:LPS heptosyltransferase|nr:glycosyltransferase family 9 protein [Steroidobacteraceae bacterium]